MKKILVFIALTLACTYSYQGSNTFNSNDIATTTLFENYVSELYNALSAEEIDLQMFNTAVKGYYKLRKENKLSNPSILTIVDFTKSSNVPRLFIINMDEKKLIHRSLVSHGRGSGDEFATRFSNIPNSYQSSLGFYVTGETYIGEHGVSLRLDGMEAGFNDKARERGIVIHSADYVNEAFARKVGRLGRSHGCPALPAQGYKEVIDIIKEKTAFFIYYPEEKYVSTSGFLNNSDYLSYFEENSLF